MALHGIRDKRTGGEVCYCVCDLCGDSAPRAANQDFADAQRKAIAAGWAQMFVQKRTDTGRLGRGNVGRDICYRCIRKISEARSPTGTTVQ